MTVNIQVGDRVEVHLNSTYWESAGWYPGTLTRADPYSRHLYFYWVELDLEVQIAQGGSTRIVSVLNPKHIRKISPAQEV